jgi:N-acetylmuramoyl-L-alanine amidase
MVVEERFLTPNKYSRPEADMPEVRAVALHWVENPRTDAMFNWNYFEWRKNGNWGYGSAHYIVDAEHIIHCVPDGEMAYHVGPRSKATEYAKKRFAPYANLFCLGVEMCHPDMSGRFEPAVLWWSKWLCAGLCVEFGLDPHTDIITHNMVTGKDCPRWFVSHPQALGQFRQGVHWMIETGRYEASA